MVKQIPTNRENDSTWKVKSNLNLSEFQSCWNFLILFLCRRKLQSKFLLKPIDTKLSNRKISSETYYEILNEMKERVSANERESWNSHWHRDAEYIFVDYFNNSPHPKYKKEFRINSYLNSLGIFQLNFSVALNDYNL